MKVLSERPPSSREVRRNAAGQGTPVRVLVDVAGIRKQRLAFIGRTQAVQDQKIQEGAPPGLAPWLPVPIEVAFQPDLRTNGFANVDVEQHAIHRTGYWLEHFAKFGLAARPAHHRQVLDDALHGAEPDAQANRFGAAGEHQADLKDVLVRREGAEAMG